MRYLTSLNFVSVTCKMRIIILPAGLGGAGRGVNVLMYVKLLACDRCSFSFLLSHFPCPRESEGARWCSPRDQAQGSRPPSPPNPYCTPRPLPLALTAGMDGMGPCRTLFPLPLSLQPLQESGPRGSGGVAGPLPLLTLTVLGQQELDQRFLEWALLPPRQRTPSPWLRTLARVEKPLTELWHLHSPRA